jgi:hypothetical protein
MRSLSEKGVFRSQFSLGDELGCLLEQPGRAHKLLMRISSMTPRFAAGFKCASIKCS